MKKTVTSLMALFIGLISFSQNFMDDVSNETIGDFPSKWDVVNGMALVDQQDGYKFISLMHGSIIKPIVNNETDNYLSEDFTVEFDVFFNQTSSLYGQRFQLRLWNGNSIYSQGGIRYKPFIIYRDGLETDWNLPEAGFAKNHLKELQTLEPVWRHVKVEVTNGKLKILMDDKIILFLPKFKMQPTMVSIGGGINDSKFEAKIGFTNFNIVSKPKETKIVMMVNQQTNEVVDINLYSNFQNKPELRSNYPNTLVYFGTLYGNYTVRPVEYSDIEKPKISSNLISNHTVRPVDVADIKKPELIDLKTYGGYTLLPKKDAQMFFDFKNSYETQVLSFNEGMPLSFQPGQPVFGDYFEKNTKFSSVTKDLVVNKNQMYLLPKGTELVDVKENNPGGNNSHVMLNGSLGNNDEEEESNTGGGIVLLDGEPVDTIGKSPSGSAEDANLPESGTDYDKEKAFEYYQEQEALKRIEFGDPYGTSGYSKLEAIDNSFITKNESNVLGTTEDIEGSNNCVTENIVYNSNSESFADFVLNSTPDWMIPGVFLKARDYIKGDYIVYDKERTPIRLIINIPGASQRYKNVNNPHQKSNLVNGVNSLQMGSNIVSMSASANYEEIHSKEEFSFKLMGKYSNKVASVSAELGMEFQENYHYYLYEVTQNMFSVDVDNFDKASIFSKIDEDIRYNDLIYVSRVNYGRKAIIVVESKYNLKKIDANIEGQLNTLVQKAKLETNMSYLNEESNFKIKALLYGGATGAGFKSLDLSIENQRIELSNYLQTASDDATLAKPISYQLKNLYGQSMGVKSVLNQTVRTCSPPVNKNIKLKVTLTDLLCIDERDNGNNNPDDYALQQSVYYKADGKRIIAESTDYKNYEPKSDCNNVLTYKENLLVCGDVLNQIHVEKSRSRVGNINNSIILNITPEQLNDPNAVFSIHTYLKEYTTKASVSIFGGGSDDKVLYNSRIDVKIQEVLAHLLNHSFENFTNSYYDTAITSRSDFYKYGTSGNVMWLAPGPSGSLEGPIRLGSIGQKAATWINFEILN